MRGPNAKEDRDGLMPKNAPPLPLPLDAFAFRGGNRGKDRDRNIGGNGEAFPLDQYRRRMDAGALHEGSGR